MAPGVTLARVNWHSLTRRVTNLRAIFDVIPGGTFAALQKRNRSMTRTNPTRELDLVTTATPTSENSRARRDSERLRFPLS